MKMQWTVWVLLALVALAYPDETAGQSVGKHVTESDDIGQFDPPADCAMAVGGTKVVVVDNKQIVVFAKDGFSGSSTPLATLPLRGASGLWASLQPSNERVVFDPRVVYDLESDCF